MTNWNHVFEESDRGCVIVALALVDEALATLLSDCFECDQPDLTKLRQEMFEGMGPLNSLSAKSKCSYAFGYIAKTTYDDIRILTKLRNKFAHFNEPVTFEDSSIHDALKKLSITQFLLEPGEDLNGRGSLTIGHLDDGFTNIAPNWPRARILFVMAIQSIVEELRMGPHKTGFSSAVPTESRQQTTVTHGKEEFSITFVEQMSERDTPYMLTYLTGPRKGRKFRLYQLPETPEHVFSGFGNPITGPDYSFLVDGESGNLEEIRLPGEEV